MAGKMNCDLKFGLKKVKESLFYQKVQTPHTTFSCVDTGSTKARPKMADFTHLMHHQGMKPATLCRSVHQGNLET